MESKGLLQERNSLTTAPCALAGDRAFEGDRP